MTLPPEYEPRWYEGLFAQLSRRIDYTNALLSTIIELLGGKPPGIPTPGLPLNKSSFLTGRRAITTAGIAEQLSTSSIPVPNGFQVTVIAWPDNTGYIYIGKTKGDAEGAMSFRGLDAGLAHSLRITDVSLIWVTSTVDGDGASWYVEQ